MELAGTPGEIKLSRFGALIRHGNSQVIWMGGHARKTSWRKQALVALASAGIVCLLFLPLGVTNHSVKVASRVSNPKNDVCDLPHIKDQLLGLKPLSSVKLGETVRLGGVMSGTFTCKDGKYRYALGLTKPERILSVTKLDA